MSNDLTELGGVYPMRVVSRLTGLSADAIRVWERRYQAVQPERTDGNKRRYSDRQVRRLVLLRRATELGHSIGEIARLPDGDLRRLIGEATPDVPSYTSVYAALIEDYLSAIYAFDVHGAESILTRTAALIPPIKLTLEVIAPLMRQVGEAWHRGELKISHEHIISSQLRNLLGTLMRHVEPAAGAPRIVVTTPPGHLHEFGAIIGAFIAASRGFEPIFLGVDMPFEDIVDAATQSGSGLILLSIARDCSPVEQDSLLAGLEMLSRRYEVWLGVPDGHGVVGANFPASLFHQYDELDRALAGYEQSDAGKLAAATIRN
ncbi:MAG: MerR family transcriptional regulator [Myxococcales bacterium]|nr:MerR family transcriptional regulator [Myxococcales bacterium]